MVAVLAEAGSIFCQVDTRPTRARCALWCLATAPPSICLATCQPLDTVPTSGRETALAYFATRRP